jgi:hypothetical protein
MRYGGMKRQISASAHELAEFVMNYAAAFFVAWQRMRGQSEIVWCVVVDSTCAIAE